MNSQNNLGNEIETTAVSALAAASKTPFKTAFLVTLGIGLGRLLLFTSGLAVLGLVIVIVSKLLS